MDFAIPFSAQWHFLTPPSRSVETPGRTVVIRVVHVVAGVKVRLRVLGAGRQVRDVARVQRDLREERLPLRSIRQALRAAARAYAAEQSTSA